MAKKIKILHLIKSLGRGGAEMLLPETLKLHNREQFEFYYAYFLDYKFQMVPDLEKQDVEVHCFNANTNPGIILKYKEVKEYIRSREIDIVHCHLPWAGFMGRLLHKFTDIPVVYTEHNNVNRYNPVTKIINNITFNWQSYAVAVSNDSYKSLLKNVKPEIPLQPLLNAVNTDKFFGKRYDTALLRKENNIPADKKVVITVAVFRPQKRLDRWVEVVKNISEQSDHFYFILVGEGKERGMIEELLQKYNLNKKVLLTGLLTDPKPYYAVADYFLLTSDFEGLPVSLLEAMSMECFPVCTDVGGIPEVLNNGKNGAMVNIDKDVVENLSKSILDVSDEHLIKLKQSARATVTEKFSMGRMVRELENIYNQVYAKRINSPGRAAGRS